MSLLSMCDQPDRIRLTERANLREWEIIKLIVIIMERKNRHVILLILQSLVIAQLLITKKYRK